MIATTDLAAFEAAWAAADDAAFAKLAPQLGCTFVHARLAPLLSKYVDAKPAEVALAVDAAIAEPCGVALRETVLSQFHKLLVLAVCDLERRQITVGVRVFGKSERPGKFWEQFRPWYKDVPRNRAGATLWASQPADDRATFELVSRDAGVRGRDEATLIRQIVDAPDDRALREVLADLWLERDDPRGELARLALHPVPDGASRIAALERAHGAQIARNVATHATAFELRGGFVDSVTLTAKRFARHGAAMFRSEPIRQLVISPLDADAISTLAASEHVALVRALRFESKVQTYRTLDLRPLAGRRLDRLEELAIHNHMIPDPVFDGLAAPRLRRAEISSSLLRADTIASLARTFSTLESLAMTDARGDLTDPDLDRAVAMTLPNLVSLEVSGPAAFGELVARWLSNLPGLRELWIDAVESQLASAIARHANLRSLTIAKRLPSPSTLATILEARLERLVLDAPGPEKDALVEMLVRVPADHPLKIVHVPDAAALSARFTTGARAPA